MLTRHVDGPLRGLELMSNSCLVWYMMYDGVESGGVVTKARLQTLTLYNTT
jgi:hypothetical protein